jgi:hypothetical protein
MGARAYVKVDCSFLHGTLHYRGPHLDLALLGLLVGGVVRAAAHAHPPPMPCGEERRQGEERDDRAPDE